MRTKEKIMKECGGSCEGHHPKISNDKWTSCMLSQEISFNGKRQRVWCERRVRGTRQRSQSPVKKINLAQKKKRKKGGRKRRDVVGGKRWVIFPVSVPIKENHTIISSKVP